MKKKQVEKEQNNEKQLPRQETTLGEDIFQLLLKIVLIILAVILVFTFMSWRRTRSRCQQRSRRRKPPRLR